MAMELKTKALDRLLDALSPALEAELDRVVKETQEATQEATRAALEQEFEKRIQTAVIEVETAAKMAAATQQEQAVGDAVAKAAAEAAAQASAQAKEETRKQVTEELEQQFAQKLSEATTRLNNAASAEHARLKEELNQWRAFAETQRQLAEASSQAEILSRFLRLVDPFADALAIYVTKADGLALWKSRGKNSFPEIISKQTTDPESYFKLITVRGKTVAAVVAAPPFKAGALDFVVASLERAIEVFGLKLKAPEAKPLVSEKNV